MKRLIRKITPKHTPSFDLGSSITMNAVKAVIDVNKANANVISCSLFTMVWSPFECVHCCHLLIPLTIVTIVTE